MLKMAFRTRPIVRPDVTNRMVTNGYRKGVYERVTKGTSPAAGLCGTRFSNLYETSPSINVLFGWNAE